MFFRPTFGVPGPPSLHPFPAGARGQPFSASDGLAAAAIAGARPAICRPRAHLFSIQLQDGTIRDKGRPAILGSRARL